jgi:hypothetical protein
VFVIDAFTRKKLFRPKTTASARLREQDELFGDGVHGESVKEEVQVGYSPGDSSVKAWPESDRHARHAAATCRML